MNDDYLRKAIRDLVCLRHQTTPEAVLRFSSADGAKDTAAAYEALTPANRITAQLTIRSLYLAQLASPIREA